MKVLDIYPNYCWSLHGPNHKTIRKLRLAVSLSDEHAREEALLSIPHGKAFRFVGDPTKLELADQFFDEISLTFTPEVSERVRFRQCIRRWSKNPVPMGLQVDDEPEPAASLFAFTVARYLSKFIPVRADG